MNCIRMYTLIHLSAVKHAYEYFKYVSVTHGHINIYKCMYTLIYLSAVKHAYEYFKYVSVTHGHINIYSYLAHRQMEFTQAHVCTDVHQLIFSTVIQFK